MDGKKRELHFVFMNYDPEYERLRSNRTKKGENERDLYLSRKHDELLAKNLQPGSYTKTLSLVIVDGFAVEITNEQIKWTTQKPMKCITSSEPKESAFVYYSPLSLCFGNRDASTECWLSGEWTVRKNPTSARQHERKYKKIMM
ncbi:unnamed protein product [Fraxinus pennsylvanica]|uniref:Uncharacterized protein n=1 Tax=Fraxinus pennsylvanica TaxID=56036 RepID=A0AAD2E1W6_9LAMI|nr:unnamed protein product [Fraxinus pennsylvanica]